MFGSLGGTEILVILVLALLLFGPRRLPEIGRTIGKGLSEFRKATHDFKMNLEREVDLDGVREARDGIQSVKTQVERDLKQAAGLTPADPTPKASAPPAGEARPPRISQESHERPESPDEPES